MNLAKLDLNLVLALRALLEERNVTRAGARIGLSQPATSAALARLRRHFDDDLLARDGNRYVLTPWAPHCWNAPPPRATCWNGSSAVRPRSTRPWRAASSPCSPRTMR